MSEPAAPRCSVCAKHALGDQAPGGVLFQDDLIYAGHVHWAGETAYRGHLVVEPRRHVEGFGLLTDDEAGRIGRMANRLAGVLRRSLRVDHVYVWAMGGAPETDRTPHHLHAHVVPRYPGTPREYSGALITRWPDAPRVDEPEMRALVADLRSGLTGQ